MVSVILDCLTDEFHQSAEFKAVRNYIVRAREIVDEDSFDESAAPLTRKNFMRFCNAMIAVHKGSMVRRGGGITVTGEGVEVSTQKTGHGRMAYTASPVQNIL